MIDELAWSSYPCRRDLSSSLLLKKIFWWLQLSSIFWFLKTDRNLLCTGLLIYIGLFTYVHISWLRMEKKSCMGRRLSDSCFFITVLYNFLIVNQNWLKRDLRYIGKFIDNLPRYMTQTNIANWSNQHIFSLIPKKYFEYF